MSDRETDPDDTDAAIDWDLLDANPSNYKTRGRLSDAGGTGVFGHSTASTGVGRGVTGRVDSTANGAAGVYGEATATTGDTYGVFGRTDSGRQFAAGMYAESASGNAEALKARAIGTGHGIDVSTDGNGSYAIWARNTGKAGTNNDHGVVGETYTAGDGIAGVFGKAKDTDNNRSYGVKGISDAAASVSTNPVGVYGEANPSGGSGAVYGVHGYNDWTGSNASAVRGEDVAGGFFVALTYGVYGTTDNRTGTGVKGEALFDSTDAYGVVGSSRSGRGVYGETNSSSGYGVYASAPGAAGPAVNADGVVSKNANATAYLTNPQTIDSQIEDLEFDATTGDDFGAFETDSTASDTGTYVVPTAGDYRVDLHLQWDSQLKANTRHSAYVDLYDPASNSTTQVAKDIQEVAGDAGFAFVTNSVSKVLMGLDPDEEIRGEAYASETEDLESGIDATFMSVSHVG